MIECGVKDFNISTWYGLFVPAKTPDAVLARLNTAITKALKSDTLKSRISKLGGEASPCSPEEFSALIKSELKKYKHVVEVSGARVD